MSSKIRFSGLHRDLCRLHHDESGPSTTEWTLAGVTAFIVLLAIAIFAGWLDSEHSEASDAVTQHPFLGGTGTGNPEFEADEDDDSSDAVWNPEQHGYPPVSGYQGPHLPHFFSPKPPETFSLPADPHAPEHHTWWWGSDHKTYAWYPATGWTVVGGW